MSSLGASSGRADTRQEPPSQQIGASKPTVATQDDYRAVERLVLTELTEDFLSSARKDNVDYHALGTFKAAAACIEWPKDGCTPHVRFWGTSDPRATQVEANAEALSECRSAVVKYDDPQYASLGLSKECIPFFEGDTLVVKPPKETVSAILKSYVDNEATLIRTLCTPWVKGSRGIVVDTYSTETHAAIPCDGYSAESLRSMRFVIDDIHVDKQAVPDIFPPPPAVTKMEIEQRAITNLESGAPEWPGIVFYPPVGSTYTSTRYKLPGGWSHDFSLHRVKADGESQVRAALAATERSKMYGRFQERKDADANDIDLPYFNEGDYLASYVRTFDLRDAEVRSALYSDDFPEKRLSGLRGEKSIRLWAECYVPVDKAWIPVRHPLRQVTPIALETTAGLYLYALQIFANNSAGGTISSFGGRVFDLSHCADLRVCQEEVSRSFAQILTDVFSAAPLAAMNVAVMNPHELRFQRLNEESKVLVGLAGPYYELSTYSLTFWFGPRDNFMGAPEHYFSRQKDKYNYDKPSDQLFMQVSHALQIGVGKKSEYPEPKPDQYSAYTKAVNTAVKLAVARTASKFGAKIVDGVGVIVMTPGTSTRKQQ